MTITARDFEEDIPERPDVPVSEPSPATEQLPVDFRFWQ